MRWLQKCLCPEAELKQVKEKLEPFCEVMLQQEVNRNTILLSVRAHSLVLKASTQP